MHLGFAPVPMLGPCHRENDLGRLISDIPSEAGYPGNIGVSQSMESLFFSFIGLQKIGKEKSGDKSGFLCYFELGEL